jgi:DNA-binding response OmpR family regulator
MESQPQHILLLEDAPTYRSVAAYNLSEAGFKVTTAAEAGKALLLAEHEQFDLAVVDYYLPDFPGTDFIKRLRELGAYEHVPIIVLTARTEELNLDYLRNELSVLVLSKSCTMKELLQTVTTCLSLARAAT